MESNRQSYVTHTEDYVKTQKGVELCILFEITTDEDMCILSTHLIHKKGVEDKVYKKNLKEFNSEKECFRFIGSVVSKFDKFTAKVLTFDDIYPEEFVQSTYNKWFDSKI